MTFTIQEVPNWETFNNEMYDINLPMQQSDQFFEPAEIKLEDAYSPYNCQPSTPMSQTMLASPPINIPAPICQSFNQMPYSPAHPSVIQSLSSPSNIYVGSPNSSYSASPVDSPQQFPSDEFLRYGLHSRQPMYSTAIQQNYYYNIQGGKRRRRDDELSPEEYEKRRLRRERNKQAALRCRTRRRERIDALEQETNDIAEDNKKVENEIISLRKQIEDLQGILKEHRCDKKIPTEVKSETLVKSEPS